MKRIDDLRLCRHFVDPDATTLETQAERKCSTLAEGVAARKAVIYLRSFWPDWSELNYAEILVGAGHPLATVQEVMKEPERKRKARKDGKNADTTQRD
jgi:hypothetical protein